MKSLLAAVAALSALLLTEVSAVSIIVRKSKNRGLNVRIKGPAGCHGVDCDAKTPPPPTPDPLAPTLPPTPAPTREQILDTIIGTPPPLPPWAVPPPGGAPQVKPLPVLPKMDPSKVTPLTRVTPVRGNPGYSGP